MKQKLKSALHTLKNKKCQPRQDENVRLKKALKGQAAKMNGNIYKNKKVLVLGAGKSGQAALLLLNELGADLCLAENNIKSISADLQKYCEENSIKIITGEHKKEDFIKADLVVTSPGVPLKKLQPIVKDAANLRKDELSPPIISEMELALSFVKAPIIALTGTSGKTTTVSLIAKMLESAGNKVFLGGNIGTPLSEYVLEKFKSGEDNSGLEKEIVVLECSSFQLSTTSQLHAKVAIFLNLAENHLDQHSSMEDYSESKFKIFQNQNENDFAIVGPELKKAYLDRNFKAPVEVFDYSSEFKCESLHGVHNEANIDAAYRACRHFGVDAESAAKAVKNFKGLKHRLESLNEKAGINFINDSKGTSVSSLEVALKSFDSPLILLAGGIFKGGELKALLPLMEKHVKHVALYGKDRNTFKNEWQGFKSLSLHEDMAEAMRKAKEIAKSGDAILLSPATSSYDQFKNYMERGDYFRKLVEEW